jgi:hypothetical protein
VDARFPAILLPQLEIPNLDSAVATAGGEERLVRDQSEGADPAAMPYQRGHLALGGEVQIRTSTRFH